MKKKREKLYMKLNLWLIQTFFFVKIKQNELWDMGTFDRENFVYFPSSFLNWCFSCCIVRLWIHKMYIYAFYVQRKISTRKKRDCKKVKLELCPIKLLSRWFGMQKWFWFNSFQRDYGSTMHLHEMTSDRSAKIDRSILDASL